MEKFYSSKLAFLCFTFLFLSLQIGNAQLTGTKTIPGNYATIAAAVTDLNTQGVGAGGVTFDVAAGHTEVSDIPVLTASGTEANPIVFQKSGVGANPKITPLTPGTILSSTILHSNGDGIFIINGGDYITIDGIDLETDATFSAAGMYEYGYFLKKASATDACKNIVIANCSITLNKAALYSFGINVSNISGTTNVTVTSTGGRSENISIYNNTISNVYSGIMVRGHAASSPYDLYDQNIQIGLDGGNTITDFGGLGSTVYGIYAHGQNDLWIAYNSISGGDNSTSIVYGIYTNVCNNANIDVEGNSLTLSSSATTSVLAGIYMNAGTVGTNNSQNVTNNTVTGFTRPGVTSGATYFIYFSSNSPANLNISGNTVGSSSLASTGLTYGIYQNGAPANLVISGNTVTDITRTSTTSTSALYGIFSDATTSGTGSIWGNTVHTITGNGSTGIVGGISVGTELELNLYGNKIYNITSSHASGVVHGITLVTALTTANVFNNLIGDLKAPLSTSTGADAIRGISIQNSTTNGTINLSYNTIFLNATSSGASFTTTGVYHTTSTTATTSALQMRNNIIVNSSTPSGTGLAIAYRRSSSTLTNYGSLSNNNLLYAGTPGPNNVIFYDGTNSDQTLALYKTRVSPRDASSVSENPVFLSTDGANSNFLHINTTTATQIESGGVAITGITNDYDSNVRFGNGGYFGGGSAPDIGADEFEGVAADLIGPAIGYTPASNSSCNSGLSLTATIADASGVNTSAGTKPRLYYKKQTDANTYAGNTSANDGWKYVEASNASSPFSFTANYALLQSPPMAGDVIQYFVVAQDLVGTPNVSINSGIFNSAPASVALVAGNFPLTGTINSFTFVAAGLSGTVTIGAAGTYTSLTGAGGLFEVINSIGLAGDLTANIIDASVTESGATALNVISYNGCAAAPYTLTIKPGSGVDATLTGISTTAIIKLNGADNVIINGSNNGSTSRNMTIENTSIAANTTAIWISSLGTSLGATNNTIKNTNIKAGSNTVSTTFGIYVAGTSISSSGTGNDNDNLTIENNSIGRAYYGIYNRATSSGVNNGLIIKNNSIGSDVSADYIGFRGIQLYQADGALIEGNTIFNIIASIGNLRAIELVTGVVNSTVSKNIIYEINYTGTSNSGGKGITVSSGTSPANITFSNNVIYGLKGHGSVTAANNTWGLMFEGGGGYNAYYNSINISDDRTTVNPPSNDYSGAVYIASSVTSLDLRDNVFVCTAAPAGTGKTYAVYCLASNSIFSAMDYNLYWATGTNRFAGFISSTDRSTLAEMQSGFGQNVNSLLVDPAFNSNTNLAPQTGSPVLNAGTPIFGISTDITGVTRNPTNPSIGAYEQGSDVAGPVITYTPLLFTCGTGNRNLNGVTIADVSGVPTSGALQPRIYYKKNAMGAWFSSQGTLASGTGTNGQWNFTIVAADMGGLAQGDVVHYYVIAQDIATSPNVISNPSSGLIATSVNSVSSPPTNPNSYFIGGTIGGTKLVGAGGDYLTLTAAIEAYNTNCLTGPVTFMLTDATYSASETFPLTIGVNPDASSINTLTIRPAAATAVTITGTSGTSPAALIRLNGADHIIIDGINAGGASLLVENTSTSSGSAVVWMASEGEAFGATNNIIRNTSVKGGVAQNGSTTVTYGIILAGSTLGTTVANTVAGADNDNNAFTGNSFTKLRYALVSKGASSANPNTGTTITNNTFGPSSMGTEVLGRTAILIREEEGTQISGNEIRFIGGDYANATSGTDRIGIVIGADALWPPDPVYVKNAVIKNNRIHDIIDERTFAAVGVAIAAADGTNATNNVVSNNMLYNLRSNGTSNDQTIGIGFNAGNGDGIYYNTIYLTGDTDADAGATTPSESNYGISILSTAVTHPTIKDNIVYMDLTSSSATTLKNACIDVPASYAWGTGLSNYNDFYYPAGNTQANTGCTGNSDGVFHLTLSAWQTAVTQDANSLNVEPIFVSPSDLHLVPASNVGLDNFGSPVAGITTDIDGDTRDVSTPDMGADEFTPLTGLDVSVTGLVAPATSGCYTSTETVTVTLVNNSLTALNFSTNNVTVTVTATGGYSSNFVLNSGSLSGSGSMNVTMPATIDMSTPGTYTFNASSMLSGDIAPGNDAMAPADRIKKELGGTYPVGVGQSAFGGYETITAFISDYNTVGCFTGNITIELYDALYTAPTETFPLVLADNPSSGTYTLTIKPRPATAVAISGSGGAAATALVKLDGTDYVTIDGVNSGGASLTIENTSITGGSAAIWLSSNGVDAGSTNNTIKNSIIKAGIEQNTSTTTTYGIVLAGSSLNSTAASVIAGNDNNDNRIEGNTFLKVRYGLLIRGGSSTNPNTGTVITNNIFGPTAFGVDQIGKGGIVAREEDGIQIIGNELRFIGGDFANTTSGTDRVGITFGTDASWLPTTVYVKNAVVANNILHDIIEERTFSSVGIGIAAADGTNPTNNVIVNNVLYNIKANGTSGDEGVGIGFDAGNTDAILYNSIYLYGDSDPNPSATATGEGNFGIVVGTAADVTNLNIRNNAVYVDVTSSSAPTEPNANINVPSLTYDWGTGGSNNNDYYINPANPQSNVGLESATFYLDLAAWQAGSGQDANSISADPVFNSTTNLKPVPGSPLLGAAFVIPAVTTDITGAMRSATTPTIGAYEVAVDESGPKFSYTSVVTPTLCNEDFTLSVNITDPSNVNTSPGTKPRMYFKKSTDANTYAGNTSADNGWKYVEASNSASPFTFTSNYALLQSPVTGGDVIQYFMVAQDMSPVPYVSISDGSYTAVPASVNLTAGAFPITGYNSFTVIGGGLSGTVTVGAAGNYTTLSGANGLFAALNASGLLANVTVTILDAAITETGTNPLNELRFDCDGPYTLTIKPAAGVTTLLSGSATALIDLSGVDNIIIDGSNNGSTSKDMTIRNTSTTGSTIRFINSATGNLIQNVIIEGAITSTGNGVVLFSTTSTGTVGNSNNILSNVNIRNRSDATTVPANLVYSSGTSTAPNASNSILNSSLFNFSSSGINLSSTGIGNEWQFTDNNIYNAQATPSASTQNGILIAGGTNHFISQNFIGGNAPGATGTWSNTGSVVWQGVALTGGTAKITNNTIANFSGTGTGTGARVRGIGLTANLTGTVVSGNTIHDLATTGTGTGLAAGSAVAMGVYTFPSDYQTFTITDNTIYNISIESTSPLTISNVAAGMVLTNLGGTVANNTIHSIKNKTTGTTAGQPPIAAGIFNRFLQNGYVVNNMISVGATEFTNTQFNGIMVAGAGSTGGQHYYYFNSVLVSGTAPNTIGSHGFLRGDNATTSVAHPVTLRNNIFSMQRSGGGSVNYAIGSQGTNADTLWSSNYNDLHNLSASDIGYWFATGYDFTNWQLNTGGDANSVSVAPLFVGTTDLHLQVANPTLDNGGTVIALVPTDFDDEPRNFITPDIGADEFVSTGCPKVVTASGDSGPNTLRDVIACAQTGETITIDPSVTSITLTSGEIALNKSLILKGHGMNNLTISGNNNSRIFNLLPTQTFRIEAMSLINGASVMDGGAFFNQGIMRLMNIRIEGSTENAVPKGFTGSVGSTTEILGNTTVND